MADNNYSVVVIIIGAGAALFLVMSAFMRPSLRPHWPGSPRFRMGRLSCVGLASGYLGGVGMMFFAKDGEFLWPVFFAVSFVVCVVGYQLDKRKSSKS